MSDVEPDGPVEVRTARTALLERAVELWKRQLVDFGGRNTLLYYRPLKQGTLDLTDADPAAVAALLDGRTVALSRLFPDAEEQRAVAKRTRTILAKAKENFEERGLATLFLTWGMATWTNTQGTATPAAPLLLGELALVPRGGAAEDLDITLAGDWDVNPTLLRWLETEHRVVLDGDELDVLAATRGLDAARSALDAAAGRIPGWSISDKLIIGNFSYAKLPMVRDLEIALSTGILDEHDLLCAMAGDRDARAALRDRHPEVDIAEPDFTAPSDEFLVLDADASQSFVVNAVVKGADLVVEGPPGTGKSQTIANLIASLAAQGRRVLFVAEKRAAIDAVLERLHHQGLGDIVLDLHGGASSRKALAQQLAKALDAASSTPKPELRDLHDRVARRRDELRHHADAVHEKRVPWDVSLYHAQSVVLGTPAGCHVNTRLTGSALTGFEADAHREARIDLDRFAALGGLALLAGRGPWAAAFQAGTVSTPAHAQEALAATAQVASTTLPDNVRWIDDVVAHCGLRAPETMASWAETLSLLDGVHATLQRFDPAIFGPELGAQLSDLTAALEPGARSVMSRLFNGGVRRTKKLLAPLWLSGKPKVPDLHDAVAKAAAQQQAWATLSVDRGRPRLPDRLTGATGAYDQFNTELRAIGAWAATGGLEARPADDLGTHLASLVADSATLHRLPELHAIRQRLHALGLRPLLDEVAARNVNADEAVAALDFAWHHSIISHVSASDPVVAGFDGPAHGRALEDFRDADRKHVQTGAARVRRAVAEHAVAALDAAPDAAAVVTREARKKQRHLPVRDLFHEASDVLTALKPCWAMSPLVVAQLLPVERCFDVVVFDEASQVTPADAIGALLRADRAVVAGDTRQLPPTTFFASKTHQDDEADVPDGAELSLVEDMESVLDVMGSLLGPPTGTRTLGWHYRSRDERLIAFSNAQPKLYDWSLTTFPGVTGGRCPDHVLVAERTSADAADSSAAEVRTVVELILDHAMSRPDQSLGVITMGIKHADRVSEALRLARRDHPHLDQFFDHGPKGRANPEPLFVKNLERVQGDERDAIILSIGYGKSADGRMQYRFGPLNLEGGERRLNVAITRARHQMTVVSSFSSNDMDPNKLRAEGAQMLARYLAYAETGGDDLGRVALSKAPLNAFERDVETNLTAAGIPLCPQFGSSGYWIDFAAQHPARPGEMVLAIECDGATYHSSATARDRDRLRQDHLERLGWRFHRIWSTDWFRHREREVDRAKAAYDAAVNDADADAHRARPAPTSTPVVPPSPPPPVLVAEEPARGPRPPIRRGRTITEYTRDDLVRLVRWIESDTLLRTEDQLLADLMAELGFQRRGGRIVDALTAAIAAARTDR